MPTNLDLASRRIWIDLSLAAAGALCAWQGLYAVAAPLVLFALVAPALRLRQRRRGEALLSLVPAELADAHRALAEAAALPGVLDGAEALSAADDAVLETAVLLVGQPPRGATQRRFVEARVTAINDMATAMRERHDAVAEAMRELDAFTPTDSPVATEASAEPSPGFVVRVFALASMPVFLVFDLFVGILKAVRALIEGIALRLRATGRVGLTVLRHSWSVLAEARSVWRSIRTTTGQALRDGRRSTTSLRLQVRLQVRQMRRRLRVG